MDKQDIKAHGFVQVGPALGSLNCEFHHSLPPVTRVLQYASWEMSAHARAGKGFVHDQPRSVERREHLASTMSLQGMLVFQPQGVWLTTPPDS